MGNYYSSAETMPAKGSTTVLLSQTITSNATHCTFICQRKLDTGIPNYQVLSYGKEYQAMYAYVDDNAVLAYHNANRGEFKITIQGLGGSSSSSGSNANNL